MLVLSNLAGHVPTLPFCLEITLDAVHGLFRALHAVHGLFRTLVAVHGLFRASSWIVQIVFVFLNSFA